MNFTRIARPYFLHQAALTKAWLGDTRRVQTRVLERLVGMGARTKWGAEKGLTTVGDPYDALRKAQGRVQSYPDVRAYVMRMVDGERDVLWPGVTRRFAQSSGTSDGKSKYIPITDASLRHNHYPGGTQAVAHYLRNYPDSRMFDGNNLILGGSFANELSLPRGVKVGDLSATLIDRINPLVNLVRVPSKRIALLSDWSEKLPALIRESVNRDIRSISGVPSWFLTVLKGVMKSAGADRITDVWPNLEVFFHGGINMEPYRRQYAAITRPEGIRYIENYNASEGFFAVQDDPQRKGMLLLIDEGIFYEFIPVTETGNYEADPVPAWEVEEGGLYSLVITACNGLWRYTPGDTVRVESVEPLRITVAGRTRCFINAFGEELMEENAERAMADVCHEMDCAVANYSAAPVYATGNSRGRHEWLIEFEREPQSIELFADRLDARLQELNSDYQAKRSHGIFLDRLSIVKGRRGVFEDWLALSGKLGGQRKVPRLSNSRHPMDEMLGINAGCSRG